MRTRKEKPVRTKNIQITTIGFANCAAAIAASRPGAIPAMPSPREGQDKMRGRNG